MSTLPHPRDAYPWRESASQQVAHVVATTVAWANSAWVVLPLPGKPSKRIVRHDDGYLAVQVLRQEDPCWYFDAWHEGGPLDLEQAITVHVAGYLVEVFYTDPAASAAAVVSIAARR